MVCISQNVFDCFLQDELDDEDADEEVLTEEQRMEEGRRMFQIFAARMFEQRVLAAYREKVAHERQSQLLRELEDEDRLAAEREAKKAKDAQKKKDKKKLAKQAKDQEKQQAEEARAASEAAAKAEAEAKAEEDRRRLEEQKAKREAERKAKEAEAQKREEAKKLRLAEEARKKKERDDKARELKAQREKEEKERKAKEDAERKARQEVERKEREEREKERREAAKKAAAEKKRQEEEAAAKEAAAKAAKAAAATAAAAAAAKVAAAAANKQAAASVRAASTKVIPGLPRPVAATSSAAAASGDAPASASTASLVAPPGFTSALTQQGAMRNAGPPASSRNISNAASYSAPGPSTSPVQTSRAGQSQFPVGHPAYLSDSPAVAFGTVGPVQASPAMSQMRMAPMQAASGSRYAGLGQTYPQMPPYGQDAMPHEQTQRNFSGFMQPGMHPASMDRQRAPMMGGPGFSAHMNSPQVAFNHALGPSPSAMSANTASTSPAAGPSGLAALNMDSQVVSRPAGAASAAHPPAAAMPISTSNQVSGHARKASSSGLQPIGRPRGDGSFHAGMSDLGSVLGSSLGDNEEIFQGSTSASLRSISPPPAVLGSNALLDDMMEEEDGLSISMNSSTFARGGSIAPTASSAFFGDRVFAPPGIQPSGRTPSAAAEDIWAATPSAVDPHAGRSVNNSHTSGATWGHSPVAAPVVLDRSAVIRDRARIAYERLDEVHGDEKHAQYPAGDVYKVFQALYPDAASVTIQEFLESCLVNGDASNGGGTFSFSAVETNLFVRYIPTQASHDIEPHFSRHAHARNGPLSQSVGGR